MFICVSSYHCHSTMCLYEQDAGPIDMAANMILKSTAWKNMETSTTRRVVNQKSNFQHGALVIQHHHDPTSNLHLLGDLMNLMKFINMLIDE